MLKNNPAFSPPAVFFYPALLRHTNVKLNNTFFFYHAQN